MAYLIAREGGWKCWRCYAFPSPISFIMELEEFDAIYEGITLLGLNVMYIYRNPRKDIEL